MKFKYYLRGIGIGIIFASIIFFTAYRGNGSSKLSDEEIKSRAKELGMVEADAPISDLISKTEDSNVTTNSDTTEVKTTEAETTEKQATEATEKETTETKTTEAETSEIKTTENTEKQTTEKQTTEKQTTEEKTTEEKTTEKNDSDNKTIEITIKKGSSSYPVCQKLQELGLIDDAAKFDDYLIENGYANRIRVGTHKLKKGMDYHTIAELISDPLD